MRAEIAMMPLGLPAFRFSSAEGEAEAIFGPMAVGLFRGAKLDRDGLGSQAVSLSRTGLLFFDGDRSNAISLGGIASPEHRETIPVIELTDGQGYSAKLGVTSLVTLKTGETHRTSAASLVLFGKDGEVVWSAP